MPRGVLRADLTTEALRKLQGEITPGPWTLIRWGTERLPAPLSIHSADGSTWITRDGLVAREADARLIAAAPDLLSEVLRLREQNEALAAALDGAADGLDTAADDLSEFANVLSRPASEAAVVRSWANDVRAVLSAYREDR